MENKTKMWCQRVARYAVGEAEVVRGQQCGQNLTRSFGIRTRGPRARWCARVRTSGWASAGWQQRAAGTRCLALAQTLPHTTRALPSTLTYFLILHHTFLYLILLTHDYRSSPCYLLLTHVGQLTSVLETPIPFSIVLGKFWRVGGYGFWGWVDAALLLIIMWVQ